MGGASNVRCNDLLGLGLDKDQAFISDSITYEQLRYIFFQNAFKLKRHLCLVKGLAKVSSKSNCRIELSRKYASCIIPDGIIHANCCFNMVGHFLSLSMRITCVEIHELDP